MKSLSVSYFNVSFLLLFCFLQTEIAKRLNAILAQIMPFLSQEVSFQCGSQTMSQFNAQIKLLVVARIPKMLLQISFRLSSLGVMCLAFVVAFKIAAVLWKLSVKVTDKWGGISGRVIDVNLSH